MGSDGLLPSGPWHAAHTCAALLCPLRHFLWHRRSGNAESHHDRRSAFVAPRNNRQLLHVLLLRPAAMPRIDGCERFAGLVRLQRVDDVGRLLACDLRHVVDVRKCRLVAGNAVAADAHRERVVSPCPPFAAAGACLSCACAPARARRQEPQGMTLRMNPSMLVFLEIVESPNCSQNSTLLQLESAACASRDRRLTSRPRT